VSGEINAVFETALKEGYEKALLEHGICRDGWSFQDKANVLPLQAADMLAWESLHYMQKTFLPAIKEEPRNSYRAFNYSSMDRGYHDRESLRALVTHIKNKIKK
jgi:hypothetical protein